MKYLHGSAAALIGLFLITGCSSLDTPALAENIPPPPAPLREFRGVWIASVSNIQWPSKPTLSTKEQKNELIGMLDQAVKLHLNAVVLQVRPNCDALYDSKIEPWSEYLTGVMGKAPFPYYDPLAFAVAEAHKRGLELHAWFNPYRAHDLSSKSAISSKHVSRTHPEIVRTYGKYLWLDPTEKVTRDYSLSVIMDVVRRYDVDGIHFDDYFYPYQAHEKLDANDKKGRGKVIDFPDDKSWQRYLAGGGKMSRHDWRRENVNVFVKNVYQAIKAQKSWVKFGISPFGIWQPGFPAQIEGLNSYETLYADSRKWLANGWVDYLSPQLYWTIEAKPQSFPVLLKWWTEQNKLHRHLWPGMVTKSAKEAVDQITVTRKQLNDPGTILWHIKSLMQNKGGISDALVTNVFARPALVPATPWLGATPPPKPVLNVRRSKSELKLNWKSTGTTWQWLLQEKIGGQWVTEILPGNKTSRVIKTSPLPQYVYLSAVDRLGNISTPVLGR